MLKKITNKIVLLLLLLFIMNCLTACLLAPGKQKNSNVSSDKFFTSRKNNVSQNVGLKCCVFNKRIYYISNETGSYGIHSMNLEGNEIRFEKNTNDLYKLQVDEKNIYYLEFQEISENNLGEFRKYNLIQFSKEDTNIQHPLDNIVIELINSSLLNEINLLDFYITNNGTIIFSMADHPAGYGDEGVLKTFALKDTELLNYKDCLNIFQISKEDENKNLFSAQVKTLDNLYLGMLIDQEDYLGNGIINKWDTKSGSQIVNNDINSGSIPINIQKVTNTEIIITLDNSIIKHNLLNSETIDMLDIPTVNNIDYIEDVGDYAYIETSGNFDKKIYYLDWNSIKLSEILSYSSDDVILHMDKEKLVVAEEDGIKVYRLNGKEKPELKTTYEMPKGYRSNNGKTDIAGDYLFLYYYNEEKGCDMLHEKINLATGERTVVNQ